MQTISLYLASNSPRRLELLRDGGYAPIRRPVDVDETPLATEAPHALVLRLAELKARTAAARLEPGAGPGVILGADTAVVLDGEALGKPRDADDAANMLRRLADRDHEVLTGLFVLDTAGARCHGEVCGTRVRFRALDEAAIRTYVATGEPLDKAGAYGIQGSAGRFAEVVEGSWSNVVGLPMERLGAALGRIGVDPARLTCR